MNLQTIRRRLSKQGPFIVRTSDGEEHRVPHPEFAWVGRFNLVVESEDGATEIIDPLHVVSISREAGRKRANGK